MKQFRLFLIPFISAFFLFGFHSEASTVEMYRLHNPNTKGGDHHYTLSAGGVTF